MTLIIAVSGKGGVGKTMVATLLVKWLVKVNAGKILAIDADADSNFPESLGVSFKKTIGDIREELITSTLPPGVEKKMWFEAKAFEITEETKDFDLLVMGRPEGPECYCAANYILREIIDTAVSSYDFVVIDCEAGLEHLSRRTTQNVDVMLIVSDLSKKSIETALRIKALTKELKIKFKYLFLVLNRLNEKNRELIKETLKETDIEVIAELPEDDLVKEYDVLGIPIYNIPENSKAYKEAEKILEVISKISEKEDIKKIKKRQS